jgi:glycolate oxidase
MNMAQNGLEKEAPAAGSLKELLGDHYTEEPFECSFYQRDLASVPSILSRLLARTKPDGIARPQTTEEVVRVVRYAAERRIPLTPRAAATTVYWNSVPVRGGLVLDLTGLKGLISLDEDRQTATVWAGTRWADLGAILNHHGFTVCSYPSSAPSATVGGWVNMEGCGIGSLKYGDMGRQVVSLQIVLPDGQVCRVTRDTQPPLEWFLGSEGTLAIVTQVELTIRRKPEAVKSYLLAFKQIQDLQQAALEFASSSPTPYNLHFADTVLYKLMAQAGFHGSLNTNTLLVTYDGSEEELAAAETTLQRIVAKSKAALLSNQEAEVEWAERCNMLKVKRAGPSVLGAEVMLPIQGLSAYAASVAKLSQQQKLTIATYGHVVAPGYMTVMSLFPCNENQVISYILGLSLTRQLFHMAFRQAGRPYGIGFWSSPYFGYRWSKPERQARQALKKKLDPTNFLNPGKVYAPPWILSPILFNLAMNILSGIRRIIS